MTEYDNVWGNRHDIWNVIWLPIVFGCNLYFLLIDWGKEMEIVFINVFLVYLILDFIWIWLKPGSVSSPKIILAHHVVTILGVSFIPTVNETVKCAICSASLVEINTWLRISKKFIKEYHLQIDILFVVSWVIIRCLLGPYVQLLLLSECRKNINTANAALFLSGFVLNSLSVKWTFDLVEVMKKRYF